MSAKKSPPDATHTGPNSMQIAEVGFHDDGKTLMAEIKLRNSSTRTLHAYATARNLQYDAATHTLAVLLSDRLTGDVVGGAFVHPRFVPVDPGGETTVTLRLPRFLTRIIPGQNMPAPKLEKIPIHEATSIQVEVDWSDTPFYTDPRAQRTARQQLVEWARSTVRQKGSRRQAPLRSPKK